MSDENKIRDAADAVKGIVEAVPVYQDTLQPAAKELGTALQTVAKTIRVALAPLSALVWGYDKISDYLETALTDKLKGVPSERLVTPNPSVAVPALEAMRYTAHEPSLRELFANLLATAMDKETSEKAHPAFIDLIRQMTPDEAQIFKFIATKQSFPITKIYFWPGHMTDTSYFPYKKLGEAVSAPDFDLIPSGVDNLSRLGLIVINVEEDTIELDAYSEDRIEPTSKPRFSESIDSPELINIYKGVGIDLIEECKSMLRTRTYVPENRVTHFVAHIKLVRLTALGRRFYEACVAQK